jgi:hypothetical protein
VRHKWHLYKERDCLEHRQQGNTFHTTFSCQKQDQRSCTVPWWGRVCLRFNCPMANLLNEDPIILFCEILIDIIDLGRLLIWQGLRHFTGRETLSQDHHPSWDSCLLKRSSLFSQDSQCTPVGIPIPHTLSPPPEDPQSPTPLINQSFHLVLATASGVSTSSSSFTPAGVEPFKLKPPLAILACSLKTGFTLE